jgi:hypothetical protein
MKLVFLTPDEGKEPLSENHIGKKKPGGNEKCPK